MKAMQGGGTVRIESQHKKGKLTARERLHFLWMKARSRR
jgi:propionyl-CoA carboxylase beta chain